MKHIKRFGQFINEAKISHIEVSVRDAQKAMEYLNDAFRDDFMTQASNYFTFTDKETAKDALTLLKGEEIEIISSNI